MTGTRTSVLALQRLPAGFKTEHIRGCWQSPDEVAQLADLHHQVRIPVPFTRSHHVRESVLNAQDLARPAVTGRATSAYPDSRLTPAREPTRRGVDHATAFAAPPTGASSGETSRSPCTRTVPGRAAAAHCRRDLYRGPHRHGRTARPWLLAYHRRGDCFGGRRARRRDYVPTCRHPVRRQLESGSAETDRAHV